MEFVFMMILGALFVVLGIFNFRGNIASIHWYNRRKVSKENQLPYGRCMGIGTGIMGAGLIVTGALQIISEKECYFYIVLVGIIIGLIFMLYAQIKYNKGLF